MSAVLHPNPTIYELLQVCHDAPQDVQDEYTAATGEIYVAGDVAVQLYNLPGPKWMIADGALPLACCGAVPQRPGVVRDWFVFAPQAFDAAHWRSVTKICRRLMDTLLDNDTHRIERVALKTRSHVVDWYAILGFRFEGTLRAYGANGEDFAAYSRTRHTNGTRWRRQRGKASGES